MPNQGPIVGGIFLGVFLVVCISLLVNRKKLDEINNKPKSKKKSLKEVGRPWKCPKCGEVSLPQFDSCWKCGTVRKEDHAASTGDSSITHLIRAAT